MKKKIMLQQFQSLKLHIANTDHCFVQTLGV